MSFQKGIEAALEVIDSFLTTQDGIDHKAAVENLRDDIEHLGKENSLLDRIAHYEVEAEELETILWPVLKAFMEADFTHHHGGWFMSHFEAYPDGSVLMTAEDSYDGSERTYKVPADIIIEGKITEYCADLKAKREAAAMVRRAEAKRAELARLEARTRILLGELSSE